MGITKKIAVFLTALASTMMLAACGGAGEEDGMTKVRFALDWTPNTNHTGVYVAMEKGYFKEAGLDVEVVPYNDSNPVLLVDSGNAEFAADTQDRMTMAKAAGADVRSVLAIEQNWTTEVSVLSERDDIKRPADLDGKIFGGFGSPADHAILKAIIRGDGGKGEFEEVTLGTSAYEALYSHDVDFTVPYVAWEGIEAADRGVELKNFTYTDYGLPNSYQMVVVGGNKWMEENPEDAKKFVQAIQRGFQDAVDNPDEAAEILQKQNPDVLTDLEFLKKSQRMLSEKYMLDESGKFGTQTQEQWSELGQFLFDNKLLVDASNNPLTEAPDWSTYFTNEYIAD